MIYVLGHKVPDTDAITSAMVYADYLIKAGHQATPISLGAANNETKFILDHLGLSYPEVMFELPDGSHVALVDHNESAQSIDNRDKHTIFSVVDHHKMGDLQTGHPLHLRFEPLASTNSILYKMYRESGFDIPQDIASLMLGGILSDTLHFRSPTTTEEDKKIVEDLHIKSGISDLTEFAMKMFAAKSDLGDISAYALIKETDFKEFAFGALKAGIACIERTNPSYCINRKNEIIDAIRNIKNDEGYDFLLVCVVDILNEKNITIVASEIEAEILHKVFGADTVDGLADLGNRISRKKQIIPDLEQKLI